VRRTELGVLFGDSRGLRLEILPRIDDAPVRLGPIALRIWGQADERRTRALLRAAVELLGPRLSEDFDPDAIELDAPDPKAGIESIIDVPSVCDRACVFCHVSQKPLGARVPRGSDEDVERAIEAATGPILFTGDDALSHPRIVELVAQAARRGRPVSLIGPPRLGVTAAAATRLATAGLRKWVTALLGASAAGHDRIAGREGAFQAVGEATVAMSAAGVAVELVTPLIRPVLAELAAIARCARELGSGAHTLLAYAPDSMVGTSFDGLVPPFDELRAALAPLSTVSMEGLPLCVLPEPRQADAASFDRTDSNLHVVHPETTCGRCELKPRCPGVATTVERVVGSTGLVPLRRVAG